MTLCVILQLDNKVAPSAHHREAGWPSLRFPASHAAQFILKTRAEEKSPFSSLHLTSGVLLRGTCPCLMMVTLIIGLSTPAKIQ